MKAIIEQIKEDIKNNEHIKNSALNNISPWKRTHYIQLASLISKELSQSKHLQGERKFELGNTISYITLQRFFENSHSNSAINDLRFLKTLDKLCIFLGHHDINEYIISSHHLTTLSKSKEQLKPFKDIIENFCRAEFMALQKLPEIKLKNIYQYVFEGSIIIKRIKEYMTEYKNANYFFDSEYEDATFELLNCEMISDDNELKVLKAHEYWNLILKTKEGKTFFYKVINYQIYYIKQDNDGVWKIWDNYNPDLQTFKK